MYSLNVPCSEEDGRCDDVPSASSNLNPCLTRRMLVDVSNTGKKYTGDDTVIPHTSLPSTHNDPTLLLTTLIEYLQHLYRTTFFLMDYGSTRSSQRSNIHDEGRRLGEEGWFESPCMSRFHMSFDWRHLPVHLVYNQH